MSTARLLTMRQRRRLSVGVVGGGINGVLAAWRLASRGHHVELFERDELMAATSAHSTKLLHGGLRYLEHGRLRLVREALRERAWWLREAPFLTRRLRIAIPIIPRSRRNRWIVRLGVHVYDYLAAGSSLGEVASISAADMATLLPGIRNDVIDGVAFFDGQMDDAALGRWAAAQAEAAGVIIHTRAPVERIDRNGTLTVDAATLKFDRLVNTTGPWAEDLLRRSGIAPAHSLDLVRGSHIVLRGTISCGALLEVPHERRVVFVLPYRGNILVGTTEVRQALSDPVACSESELAYLLDVYNYWFTDHRSRSSVIGWFAGLRPLVRSATDPSRASREEVIERHGAVVSLFGGKWTTARAVASRVAARAEA